MKVLQVVPSIHKKYGGPSKLVPEACAFLNQLGVTTHLATTHTDRKENSKFDFPIFSFKSFLGEYKYSPGLQRWLSKYTGNYDVIHYHSLFCYSTQAAVAAAFKMKVPGVFSPHGQLYDWALKSRSYSKKKLYMKIKMGAIAGKAKKIHFTTKHEMENSVFEGNYSKKSFVLPYLLDLQFSNVNREQLECFYPSLVNRSYFLFLSRLHPKKGLEIFFEAVHSISNLLKKNRTMIVVAGDGDKNYVDRLKLKVSQLGLDSLFLFVGDVRNEEKSALLRHGKAMVLPSYSENFGIAVSEALACGLPAIVSEEVGIASEVVNAKAGFSFSPCASELKTILQRILEGEHDLQSISKNAFELANSEFAWRPLARKQIEIYSGLLI